MANIPERLIRHIEYVFSVTYFREGAEDRVLIYADEQGNLSACRPEMIRHRSSVVGDVPLNYEHDGRMWDLVCDTHSHHLMGAFWSRTDDDNERIRGPVFGVYSWKNGPEWKFRRWLGPQQGFIDLPYAEVVAGG